MAHYTYKNCTCQFKSGDHKIAMGDKMSDHKILSFIKSIVRILACCLGMYAFTSSEPAVYTFFFLFMAELIGVLGEFEEK
jgi:hypothetical protein